MRDTMLTPSANRCLNVGISGVAHLATGLYELATGKFVGTKTARPPCRYHDRSDDEVAGLKARPTNKGICLASGRRWTRS